MLEIENLNVDIRVPTGTLHAVRNLSLKIRKAETLCLVGESGCGKSMTALAIMGLLPQHAVRSATRLTFGATDLLSVGDRNMRDIRGRDIAMIFQEPMTCLNACLTVGEQLMEVHLRHQPNSERSDARSRALYLLEKVEIPGASGRLKQYPHELSGGLRQRVMIAMALMCSPKLIIADEPTTALDVTIQAQILGLLQDLQQELGLAVLLVTHDLGIVARMAQRVAVMYAGEIVEEGLVRDVFEATAHPYTQGLLECMPVPGRTRRGAHLGSIRGQVPSLIGSVEGCSFRNRCAYAVSECSTSIPIKTLPGDDHRCRCVLDGTARMISIGKVVVPMSSGLGGAFCTNGEKNTADVPLLEAKSASHGYRIRSGIFGKSRTLRAVDNINLSVRAGEVVAIVGESGCGKSTLAMLLLGLLAPTEGEILVSGRHISELGRADLPRRMQPVFQDPYSSLNPRRRIGTIIGEPLVIHRIGSTSERTQRVLDMLDAVGVPARLASAYPNQLSGGQRQRVAIARALVMQPHLLICDEPTSALDVSVQAQVLNLLLDLRRQFNLTYILISHNLAVVEHMSTRVCVMHLGRIVEEGTTAEVLGNPRHPYTRTLLQSVLTPDPTLSIPRLPRSAMPTSVLDDSMGGCAFASRCQNAFEPCAAVPPEPQFINNVRVECHLYAPARMGSELVVSSGQLALASSVAGGSGHSIDLAPRNTH